MGGITTSTTRSKVSCHGYHARVATDLQVPKEESENESDAETHEPGEEEKGGVLIFSEEFQHHQDLLFLTAIRRNGILGRH